MIRRLLCFLGAIANGQLAWHPWQEFSPEFPMMPRRVCLGCHRRQKLFTLDYDWIWRDT